MLRQVIGVAAASHKPNFFQEGRETVDNNESFGHPSTTITDDTVQMWVKF